MSNAIEIKATPEEQKKTFFNKANMYVTILFVCTLALGGYSIFKFVTFFYQICTQTTIMTDYSSTFLLAIISAYAASWIWGLYNDLKYQELTFCSGTNKGELPLIGRIFTFCLAAIFLIGFFLSAYLSKITWFAALLLIFLIINCLSWYWLTLFYGEIIEKDLKSYEVNNNLFGILKLKEVKKWITAPWQTWRFALAILFITGINVLIQIKYLNPDLQSLLRPYNISLDGLFIFLISTYIISLEGSILYFRLKKNNLVDYIICLENHFILTQKEF